VHDVAVPSVDCVRTLYYSRPTCKTGFILNIFSSFHSIVLAENGSAWTYWAALALNLDWRGTLRYWTLVGCTFQFSILSTTVTPVKILQRKLVANGYLVAYVSSLMSTDIWTHDANKIILYQHFLNALSARMIRRIVRK